MIEIQNIEKILGYHLSDGRWITKAGDYSDTLRPNGDEYYEFVVSEVGNYPTDYDKKQTIVLSKIPGNRYNPRDTSVAGKYEMFNMGLQATTSHYLTKMEIQNVNTILTHIAKVMDNTKTFYKNNKQI